MKTISRLRNFLIIFSLIGLIVNIKNASAESNLSEPYDNLFLLVTILSIIVGVGVTVLWIYFMIKFRESDENVERVPLSHESSKKLEVAWTGIAVIIVLILMIFSYPVLFDLDSTSASSDFDQEVVVRGQQFSWVYWNGSAFLPTITLDLSLGNTFKFTVFSIDVIHSYFVPDLHFKIDAVPGSNNSIVVTIEDTGVYPVWCNELCGIAHSEMLSTLNVIRSQ